MDSDTSFEKSICAGEQINREPGKRRGVKEGHSKEGRYFKEMNIQSHSVEGACGGGGDTL